MEWIFQEHYCIIVDQEDSVIDPDKSSHIPTYIAARYSGV